MKESRISLDRLFNPKNVVIYQVTKRISFFVEGFRRQGFDLKKIFLVSTNEKEILGIRCHSSIDEFPEDTIDLLILSIRRELLLESLEYILSKKQVRFIHIFTAGTGEFDDFGFEIERKLKELLDSYKNTRAIGPNCMGVYSPRGKTAYYSSFPTERGNIGLIFQSGDLHSKFIKFGSKRYNLRFSIGVSIGNCIDIQISEILNFLNKDDETDIICVYFEGISSFHKNEGKNLFKVMKLMEKPVLFMRGGRTARGQSAVLTHTGALATRKDIWGSIFKQTPILDVPPSLDELIDYSYLFSNYIPRMKNNSSLSYPRSKRTLVILWSGGFGILATDTLTELGIQLPYFEGEKLERLKEIFPLKIGSLSNPFDLPWIIHRKEFLDLTKAAFDENIDLVIVETDAWRDRLNERFKSYYNNLIELRDYVELNEKIFIIILHQYPSKSQTEFKEMLKKDNFIVYPTIEAAAKSFLKLYEYGKKISRENS